MAVRREPAHVDADFGDDDVSAEILDAWDRHQELNCGAKGPDVRLHLRVDRRHGGIESIDLIEMKAQQEAMVLGHAAAKRLAELLRRCLYPPIRKAGQFRGVAFAGNQCLDHRAAAHAHEVGDHRVQLDVGVFQRLLQPLHMARLLTHQLLAGAQQVAHLLGLRIRHEARPDQTVRQQIGQPVASLTSVLRPGTFLTCAAFANSNVNSPSPKMCHTGFQ